jgi:tetratricopeptide (TPR) repeat protein
MGRIHTFLSTVAFLCGFSGMQSFGYELDPSYFWSRDLYELNSPRALQHNVETAKKTFGERHPEHANALYSLALYYIGFQDADSLKKAEMYLKRALEIQQAILPKDHIDIAKTLSALAQIYMITWTNNNRVGSPSIDTKPFLQRAIAIREESFRALDRDYERDVTYMVELLQGDYEQAEPMLRRLLKVSESKRSVDSHNVPIDDAAGDRTARIWGAATAKEIAVLRGHENTVRSAAFSPDGTRIVTASGDNTGRIWDAHFATMSTKDLLIEVCTRRLRGLATLRRDEMRLAGYPDSAAEIDVCKGIE